MVYSDLLHNIVYRSLFLSPKLTKKVNKYEVQQEKNVA